MSTRALLAAAFAVLGTYYTGTSLAEACASALFGSIAMPVSMAHVMSGLLLGLLLLAFRNLLASLLAGSTPPPERGSTGSLQVVGITLLGLWMFANGVATLLGNGMQWVLAARPEPGLLDRNVAPNAIAAVGFALLAITPLAHGWLQRRRS